MEYLEIPSNRTEFIKFLKTIKDLLQKRTEEKDFEEELFYINQKIDHFLDCILPENVFKDKK